ncbi:hypothetical protein J4219_04125 [Candidatus Woesearchaeota archaeon]|nr:hypothetical protein [Candidatus Woesearchaeota archaeon]
MKTKLHNGQEVYCSGYLFSNLNAVVELVADKFDGVLLFSGREGEGKSTLACQVGTLCESIAISKGYKRTPTFTLESLCYDFESLQRLVLKAPPFTVILFDEAYATASSRGSMSTENKRLVWLLTTCRSRQLILLFCIANFFEVDKYLAVYRSRCLIEVYTKPAGTRLQRGFFKFYSYPRKQSLYLAGKKDYSSRIQPDFRDAFTKFFPFDDAEYERRKLDALAMLDKKPDKFAQKLLNRLGSLMVVLSEKGWTQPQLALALSKFSGEKVSKDMVQGTISRFKDSMVGVHTVSNLESEREKSGMTGGDTA